MKILKEIGDLAGERAAYRDLANAYCSLGVYQKAIEYHGKKIEIAKEVVDRAGEAARYGNLSNATAPWVTVTKTLSIMKNV